MELIYSILGYPLGFIMWFCYKIIPNYGLALILFAIITKAAMIPLAIKQQKSTVKMRIFQPKMAELQKKYANNREKLAEEMNALYAREGYSPMSGCLPMLIQFPILFGLIDVIYKPMTHIIRISGDVISQAVTLAADAGLIAENLTRSLSVQINLIGAVKSNPDVFSSLGSDVVSKISTLDLSFLGLDLSATPHLALNLMVLIPVLSAATSFLLSWVSMKSTGSMADNPAAAGTTKSMMIMMPIMMLWFTSTVPAGVGIYWIISNVIAMIQAVLLNKFYNVDELAAASVAADEERRAKEREEKLEARKRARETADEDTARAFSQKEIDKQKLAEARRRMSEKYGDTYEEVTDKDLK